MQGNIKNPIRIPPAETYAVTVYPEDENEDVLEYQTSARSEDEALDGAYARYPRSLVIASKVTP